MTTSSGTLRPMMRLATPVLVEQLLLLLVAFVDQWLAGKYLAEPHLAAIGLMWYVLWLIPSMFSLIAIGATAMTARFVGAGQTRSASHVTNQAFVAGSVLAVAATLVVYLFGDSFVRVMQLDESAAPLAGRYLQIMLPVIPAIMIEQVGIACLRGAGDTVSGFLAMSLVNLANLVVGASLVIGWGPFPAIGWEGLAIGTAVGHACGALTILLFLLRGRAQLQLRRSLLRPDPKLIQRLLRIGVPGGVDVLAIVLCHLWYLSIINRLGTLEAAAHGLGVRIESLAYLPGTAFQVAAATLAGQFLGARQYRLADRSVLMACLVGGGVMVSAGVLFYFGAEWLAHAFLGDRTMRVAELAAPLLRVVAFAMPFLALMMILTGALRGAGDTRWPLAFTFIGFLAVRIPGAYLLAWDEIPVPLSGLRLEGMGWGVIGAWYAMVTDLVVRSLLVSYRFWHGGWKRIKV